MIQDELLLSLLENVDDNKSRLNEVVRKAKQPNKAIQIIKNTNFCKREKQEDGWNGGQGGRIA